MQQQCVVVYAVLFLPSATGNKKQAEQLGIALEQGDVMWERDWKRERLWSRDPQQVCLTGGSQAENNNWVDKLVFTGVYLVLYYLHFVINFMLCVLCFLFFYLCKHFVISHNS